MTELYPEDAVLLAPVAGHTDLPMRMTAREFGCRYAFTEMIDAGSLVFQAEKTMKMLERGPAEPFLGVQLVGSEPDILGRAAEILNAREFDVLDLNLGCPAPKVARKNEGAMFVLKDPDGALRAVETLLHHSRFPVSVKTRILSETDPEPTVAFCRRLEQTGISALTLHGRVMKTFYSGPVYFPVIRAVREALSIPVIANGGALTPETYRGLLAETGCSRGMIARGALGNPWIFRELSGGLPPTVAELASVMERHMHAAADFYGVDLAFRVMRKTMLEYLRGRGFPGTLRASVSYLAGWNTFDMFLRGVRQGPSERYREFLETKPGEAERRLSF